MLNEPLLTRKELAQALKVAEVTISVWQRKCGLPVIKAGRLCRYHLSSAMRWLEAGGPRRSAGGLCDNVR